MLGMYFRLVKEDSRPHKYNKGVEHMFPSQNVNFKITYLKHYELLEDLAESIFNIIFKNKLVKKINLRLEKLDILKKTKSVGIEVSKSKV